MIRFHSTQGKNQAPTDTNSMLLRVPVICLSLLR